MESSPKHKQDLVNQVPYWWHSIDLGDQVITPGKIKPQVHQLLSSAIPQDLSGKTVLDIGTWDGYYAFECEKRGGQVLAIDNNLYQGQHRGFQTAKEINGSDVEFREMDVYDLLSLDRKFDIVLLFGLIYHLKYPLKALETVAKVTNELLILETHFVRTFTRHPMMRFYPTNELNNDPSNWWGPNLPCIDKLLLTAGFKKIEKYTTYNNRPFSGRAIFKAYK